MKQKYEKPISSFIRIENNTTLLSGSYYDDRIGIQISSSGSNDKGAISDKDDEEVGSGSQFAKENSFPLDNN